MIFRIVCINLFIYCNSLAQCPTLDFSLDAASCKGDLLTAVASINGASNYLWDFCDGSIAKTPSTKLEYVESGISSPYDLQFFVQGGLYYGFIVDYGSGKLFRLDFGQNLTTIPDKVDLGNFAVFPNPLGIGFWSESNIIFALVITQSGSLYRINFGNSILNAPIITQINGVNGMTDHRQMKIINENGSVLALVAGGGTGKLSILNFGSSISNQPTLNSFTISAPNSGFLVGIDVIIKCGHRSALVSGFGNGLFELDFGSSFLNTPSIAQPADLTSGNFLGMSIVENKNQFFALISDQNSGILRVDFGTSVNNLNPAITSLGTFGGINLAIGHTIVKQNSIYFDISISADGTVRVLEFPKDCDITDDFNGIGQPSFSYDNAGNFFVSLLANNSNGETESLTKSILVNELLPLEINQNGACIESPLIFNGSQQDGVPLSGISWDFGDGQIGTGQDASHDYNNSGEYLVLLRATASNGCVSNITKPIKIYESPVASFLVPSGLTCSNSMIDFANTTIDNFNGELSYHWEVDNLFTSSERNLNHSFASTGNHNIDLLTSIPGCTSQSSQVINIQEQGPLVDFSASTGCQGSPLQFANNTSGSGLIYEWDFGNGNTSTFDNPSNTYLSFGNFIATLHADNGVCNNSATKPITIYSKPQPNFSLDLPPFSCQGTPSQFNDLTPNPTDSNLSSWSWNFGDAANGTSGQRNPLYTYSAAGPYDVSLDVTTNFGCSASVQKTATITTAPLVNFSNTPACVNQPTQFTDASAAGVKSWLWKIDNSTYMMSNPVHTFTTSGSHNVELTITGANDCIAQMIKTVMVPVAVSPDFSVENACSEKPSTFLDVTVGGTDPVVTRNWDFAGLGSATGASPQYAFAAGGSYSVKLNTTHQSGCVYIGTKTTIIGTSPKSLFTSSAEGGPPPLTIKFSNSSTGASSYLWKFNDKTNTTSLLTEPSFTFNELGEYQVELTSFGQQGCTDTFIKPIYIVEPKTDLSLTSLELLSDPNSGSLRPLVTIKNNGNIAVPNVSILIDLSGGGSIKEKMQINLQPNQSFTQALVSELLPKGLNYVCAQVNLENDENVFDNKRCSTLAEDIILFAPYPNPSQGQLYIDWIATSGDVANIVIFNSTGANAYDKEVVATQPGLSQIILDISTLGPGIYFVVFSYGSFTKTHRFMVN